MKMQVTFSFDHHICVRAVQLESTDQLKDGFVKLFRFLEEMFQLSVLRSRIWDKVFWRPFREDVKVYRSIIDRTDSEMA